jgi:hypothetical protein
MNQMLMPRVLFFVIDLMSAATAMNLTGLTFAVLQVGFDFLAAPGVNKVDGESNDKARDDLDSEQGKAHIPTALNIGKDEGQSFVAAGDKDGDQSSHRDMAFGIKIGRDDRDSALRNYSKKRPKQRSKPILFLEQMGDLSFKEGEKDMDNENKGQYL